MPKAPSQLTFGGHRLDAGTRQLFRGADEVHISPKAFDLLHALIENRSRAMSKTELYERLWPGTFVTEANLASLVAELRRALDDPPKDPKFIRTVHRFGYAFCGQIEGEAPVELTNYSIWIVWRGQEIPLRDGENIIGRDAGVQVRIDAPSVSRRHARILVAAEGLTFEDLGSKNGSFLGNLPVSSPVPLADRDELKVGSVQMVIRIMRGGESTQTMH